MLRKYLYLLVLLRFIAIGAAMMLNTSIVQVSPAQQNEKPTISQEALRISQANRITALPFDAMEVSSHAFPQEIFFGDTLYCQITRKNHTEKPIVAMDSDFPVSALGEYSAGQRFVISADGIVEDYTCSPEKYHYRYKGMFPLKATLQPGESMVTSSPLEFPPLEAMEHPFWKKLLTKMSLEGVKCTISIRLREAYICPRELERKFEFPPKHFIYTHEILIKPRPGKEQKLLDEWLRDTPEQFLPPLSRVQMDNGKRWYTPEMDAFERIGYRQSGDHFVEINGQKYNPWCFIRDGNRKPSAQVCPTTPEGWHQLEKSLEPSTMRDEIQLSRMLMEYLGAEGKIQVQKRENLIQWLKSLPEPQSMSMASNLGDMFGMYGQMERDPTRAAVLSEPYYALLKEIHPMMSHYHRREIERVEEYFRKLKENQAQ